MPPMSSAVHSDPDILGGTPAGDPLGEFLEDFPSVSREQAIAALDQAKDALLARVQSNR